jgi:Uma2 family endonuclease
MKTEATVDDLYRVSSLKRADYFAAGTLVGWDVDVLRERVVRVYRANEPDTPTVYRAGEMAEAEPAMPSWSVAASEILAA